MKIPRDVSGDQLIRLLSKLGYQPTRQTGSHVRLTRDAPPIHHLTIPKHNPIKIGTLNNILKTVSDHLTLSKEELIKRLWG